MAVFGVGRLLPEPADVIAAISVFAERRKGQAARERVIKDDPKTKNVRLFVAAETAVLQREIRRHVIERALGARRAAGRGGLAVEQFHHESVNVFFEFLFAADK